MVALERSVVHFPFLLFDVVRQKGQTQKKSKHENRTCSMINIDKKSFNGAIAWLKFLNNLGYYTELNDFEQIYRDTYWHLHLSNHLQLVKHSYFFSFYVHFVIVMEFRV